MNARNCLYCNSTFSAIRDWHRFCSDKCRIKYHQAKPASKPDDILVLIKDRTYRLVLDEK
jgi:predicted nucleic acid-binding Zn ribbon protein